MWPPVKKLMQHIMDDYDTEGDGVIRGEQPNTYDISIYGPNTFIGSLYLAALRAADEMAKLQGETELAQQYRVRLAFRDELERLRSNLDLKIVLVVTGGTGDIPVAEEAAVTAAAFGNPVDRLYDVGVAGIHRLLGERPRLDAKGIFNLLNKK